MVNKIKERTLLEPVYGEGGHRCPECWLLLFYPTTDICHFHAADMTLVWVGHVNMINELSGSGNRELSDKIMNLKLGHSLLLLCCCSDSGNFCGFPHSKLRRLTQKLRLSTHINFHEAHCGLCRFVVDQDKLSVYLALGMEAKMYFETPVGHFYRKSQRDMP